MYFVDTENGEVDIFDLHLGEGAIDRTVLEEPLSSKNYLIAFIGRSGSTLLCSLLKKAKSFGHPDEFTNPRGPMQMYLSRHPARDLISYIHILRRVYSSPNGVFGLKSSYIDFEPMINHDLVDRCLAPLKYIYLTRQDIVLQAISFMRAKQTRVWHRYKHSLKEPNKDDHLIPYYDERAILQEIEGLTKQQEQWETFFAQYGIQPLRISYEILLEDVPGTLACIASYLDIKSFEPVTIEMADTLKVGDDTNEVWALRIRERYKL